MTRIMHAALMHMVFQAHMVSDEDIHIPSQLS